MNPRGWLLVFALVPVIASAGLRSDGVQMTAEQEAQALMGAEYSGGPFGRRIIGSLSCTDEGGGLLQIADSPSREWWHARVECRGRQVLLLTRSLPHKDGKPRWKVVDTLLLPRTRLLSEPYEFHLPDDLWLFGAEHCTLEGGSETYFVALVRWTERELIDWRTGVEHAWTFDLEKQRIVPVSTKRVFCEQPLVD